MRDVGIAVNLFQNHIPARGRKHMRGDVLCILDVISKPYPRKETETSGKKEK